MKERRYSVIEMLLVSLRPRQLLAGKLLGLGALSLVQYVGWILIAGLALAVAGRGLAQFLFTLNLSLGEMALRLIGREAR